MIRVLPRPLQRPSEQHLGVLGRYGRVGGRVVTRRCADTTLWKVLAADSRDPQEIWSLAATDTAVAAMTHLALAQQDPLCGHLDTWSLVRSTPRRRRTVHTLLWHQVR